MCGLTGLLRSAPRGDIISQVARMTARLRHRGPDDEGVWAEGGIGLGHKRLAILDLSPTGAQPMHSDSERYVLAYNGEIYNHLDLRHALEIEGAAPSWRGQSDTETLLAAIAHWGLDVTLCRAHGMFALALWDRAEKRLSLARDRMGEKPLYWGWAGEDLVFGSELKALRAHPDCPREVCREALVQYLQFMYVPAPRSIHPGLYKLEPGTILTVDGAPPATKPKEPIRPGAQHSSLSIRRYWNLNTEVEAGADNQIQDECEAVSTLGHVLGKAVQRQMLSDVPLGAFLSGGVDSSAIVALMQAKSERPVKTFTIGLDEAAFDESPHAAAVARHLGTDHTKLHVTDADARAVIPDLPQLYDEPFADSSQIPTHLVCRAARQHVTVALSGDGGDELFGGYNRYFWGPRIWDRFAYMPHTLRRGLGLAICAVPQSAWNAAGPLYSQERRDSSVLGDKAHRLGYRLQTVKTSDDLYRSLVTEWPLHSRILKEISKQPSSQLDDPLPKFGADDPAMLMMVQDMRSYLPDDILCKVDRAAMGISLETRTPFLDPDVIRLATRLPMDMKIRDGKGKWALRQMLYQHVPNEIIDRPKAGFAIPIGIWLRGPLRDWAEDLLSPERLAEDGLFNPDIIYRTWSEHLSGRRDWTTRLWAILMFQAWYAAQANA
ncbi:asparagine synthase (glutamine-hydrolyzing) [Martelella mediterranea]|uniref:asparagine synthase (glutamine-hydrolyzing) n=1 Tax=Martelella mediterranea TaxID=293089 RepID=UPI001E44FB0E|nr:asparagine synthase (glutamine-hydrolyzing) [Martelella mediterranea]MCD1636364.1 asparagine synthase (glutamine-hydrolyzing) [Martelella mediterranea]